MNTSKDGEIDDLHGRPWAATGDRRAAGGLPDVANPAGLARTWLRAVRRPWAAAAAAVIGLLGAGQLLRMVYGALEEPGALTGTALLVALVVLIDVLPMTTVGWRIGSIVVAMHVAPLFHAPPERASVGAFLDSWAATVFDERGMQILILWVVALMPLCEGVGAWVRRDRLGREAVNGRSRRRIPWGPGG